MKKLDEVIKAYEICLNINETSCRGCPYTEFNAEGKWACSLCGDCTFDAFYYLKEYREKKQEIADISVDYVVLKQWWVEQQENLPLTWDELKTMKGKPVWIEYMDDEQQTGWALIAKNPERPTFGKPKLFTLVREDGKFYLTISGYGKRWQAYRREKK